MRADLILPADAAPGTNHILLRIKAPKIRGRAAKHQAARVDPQNLVQLISTIFGPLPPTAKLWPLSAQTLRKRLKLILERLGLVTLGHKTFELASFRPGGATCMMEQTESSELVRRRGRWM